MHQKVLTLKCFVPRSEELWEALLVILTVENNLK